MPLETLETHGDPAVLAPALLIIALGDLELLAVVARGDLVFGDAAGNEVARITKTWEGLAKTMFTSADNYVLQIHRPLEEPMRSLVVASAVSVDLALKQDSRGLG